jgi:L-iditol 2-dehydrogenase
VRVVRTVAPREARVEEAPAPVAGPGDVVVALLACGICGSDVSDGHLARKALPAVLGHELVGEVVEVGAGETRLGPGDRVIVHHHVPCGECRRCRRGHETLCDSYQANALDPGGLADRFRVPAGPHVDELLPLGALDIECGTFVEPLACVLRALNRAGLRAGDTLLVVGAGTSGLLAIAAAHARGVEAVWVREPRPERLERALELGAERHGNELVDVALVCTPSRRAIADAAVAMAPGGTLCMYAAPGARLDLDAERLYMGEIDLCSSYAAAAQDMRAAFDLIAGGRVDPAPLVTHRVPLDDAQRAFDLARSFEAIKALVVP